MAVLPKPPVEPVSAKLAYSKLRTLPPLRDFGRHRPARTALHQDVFWTLYASSNPAVAGPIRRLENCGSAKVINTVKSQTFNAFWIPHSRETPVE